MNLFASISKFPQACKAAMDIGELLEKEVVDIPKALEMYEKAADYAQVKCLHWLQRARARAHTQIHTLIITRTRTRTHARTHTHTRARALTRSLTHVLPSPRPLQPCCVLMFAKQMDGQSQSTETKAQVKLATLHAQQENWERAIELFEQVAESMVDNNLLKFSCKECVSSLALPHM